MILRSGVDLVEIRRFRSLKPTIRERFIARVFTEAEIADCRGHDERLAGRFAVKEAVSKALGTGIGIIRWQDVEVLRGARGEPEMRLDGQARVEAETLGITQWSVSISHTHDHAVAIVIGLGE
ncbi:MAG: holo-ACP synthase [Anaerolineaceae bacterium]|nr:holo-ACP synthase [Anaerolineaceae bacterium]